MQQLFHPQLYTAENILTDANFATINLCCDEHPSHIDFICVRTQKLAARIHMKLTKSHRSIVSTYVIHDSRGTPVNIEYVSDDPDFRVTFASRCGNELPPWDLLQLHDGTAGTSAIVPVKLICDPSRCPTKIAAHGDMMNKLSALEEVVLVAQQKIKNLKEGNAV